MYSVFECLNMVLCNAPNLGSAVCCLREFSCAFVPSMTEILALLTVGLTELGSSNFADCTVQVQGDDHGSPLRFCH